jgi:glycerophosphoryl diester phosphodiesterase
LSQVQAGGLVRSAATQLRRLWWPLLATDLLVKAVIFALLGPGVAAALRWFLALGGTGGVVADKEILTFMTSPVGLVAALLLGSASLALVFVEHVTLVVLVLLDRGDGRIRPVEALAVVLQRLLPLVQLGLHLLVRVILITLPFVAAIGGVALLLVTEHDINFYLTVQPPEWRWALWISGGIALVGAVVLLRVLSTWILALPHLMVRGGSAREALEASAEGVAHRRGTVVWVVAGWAAGSALVGALLSLLVALTVRGGLWVLPDRLSVVAAWLLAGSAIYGLGNLLVTFLSAGSLAVLVADLFRAWATDAEQAVAAWRDARTRENEIHRGRLRASRRGVLAVAGVGVIAGWLGLQDLLTKLEARQSVEIIAHRGSSLDAPENTLAAVERAIVDGADWVEIDVQETADGRVVLAHDRDLMKVGGVPLRIGTSTFEELSQVDIGSWFAPEFSDQRVPLLEEVLELARGRAGVLVELKYYGTEEALEQRVVDLVEAYGMVDETEHMSLELRGALELKSLRPEWTVGLLTAVKLGDLTRQRGVDFLAVNAGIASVPFINRAHAAGHLVFVWTVNDPVDMSVLISKGIDGLITDDPALARQVLRERAELSGVERLIFLLAHTLGIVPAEEPSPESET